MVKVDEETLFIARYVTGGILGGMILLCMLFYLINLTGDYKSIQSIAFLVSIFGMIGSTACWTIYQFTDPFYYIHITIANFILSSAVCGYFVILIYNAYEICLKVDFIMITLTILPLLASGFIPVYISFTRYFGVKDNIDLKIVDYFNAILDVLVYANTNYICYRRFYEYKNNEVMDKLLFQYKVGIITVLMMDAILCSLTFVFVDRTLFYYNLTSIVMIGLTMEYFLLCRLRKHVMYLIQEA
ncbi:hypothetical protein CONCODRAFT_6346 [Conidiobolus coronatus NRRL 28638]|uniref:Uncharacterized protein n=1 Tax=Conidiobolus coronatus (strain ATCC 28846 / CBS 209.66 / NRRL 28638) TaxID=796925 RepID=A0A137P7U1_CONC2|nr:hypothetical protein CONCODRAFT_6346 [Conidiobolus coronatus NRRL 28638]|eukprot:KXN71039.1 hypothetical protein CONCODRAFT_6346 [Conidiobolus coronatus NRRL 28638]